MHIREMTSDARPSSHPPFRLFHVPELNTGELAAHPSRMATARVQPADGKRTG